MKKQVLTILALMAFIPTFAQFTTGTVTLTTGFSIKIDTDATKVTLTLIGPSNTWLGIGFGGTSMSSVNDMFIWNSSSNRDYTPSGGQSTPSPDAVQSWTIVSDDAPSSTRTIVATRPLDSSNDFTFLNSSASISIIYALSNTQNFGEHNGNHSS
ncbi:DOMON domain-containing protein, partial [Flavobacterium sp.]|uniref:DOMON domain-containing protein n=1 Tax=Flavobacterium sp. TaxID=239 RepID=UPI0038FC6CA8